jgi:hypothetical protein
MASPVIRYYRTQQAATGYPIFSVTLLRLLAPLAGALIIGAVISGPLALRLARRRPKVAAAIFAPMFFTVVLPLIRGYRQRMGWTIPWYSLAGSDFNKDFGRTRSDGEMFGLSLLIRDDAGKVYRTYFTERRGVEALGTPFTLLDLTPYGRQEKWETSPQGWPQGEPCVWWPRHDEYEQGDRPPSRRLSEPSYSVRGHGGARHPLRSCAPDRGGGADALVPGARYNAARSSARTNVSSSPAVTTMAGITIG